MHDRDDGSGIRTVVEAGDVLGEGPVWDAGSGALWWVDIQRSLVERFRPIDGVHERWAIPEQPGSIALRADGTLLLAVRSGFARFDPEATSFDVVHRPEPEREGNRFNDGKCDPDGRFWAASMDAAAKEWTGALYRYAPDGGCVRVLDDLGIPNTLAWSPDGRTFYFAESLDRTIFAFDFAGGEISHRRVFATVRPPAVPDGSAIDAEGCLWNAEWDGWRVVRYRPDGSIDRVVALPVQRPTSCAFGGRDLDVLYITTARAGLDESQLEDQPLAGAVFAAEVGIRGLAIPRFG